ncbi:MAG: hypothetical protein NZ578_12725 [Candidatus Binatia bacterium]|nr:hypothetical protein [Candidatus Binatia bacterium]
MGPMALFSKPEAEAKLHKTVRARMPLRGVPVGTTGKVVRVEESPDGCSVVVVWDSPASTPRPSLFSKDFYALYLEEV